MNNSQCAHKETVIYMSSDLKSMGSSEYSDTMLTLCLDRYELRARIWMIPAEFPPQPLQSIPPPPPPPYPFSCGQARHSVIKSTRKNLAKQERQIELRPAMAHLAAAEWISRQASVVCAEAGRS